MVYGAQLFADLSRNIGPARLSMMYHDIVSI